MKHCTEELPIFIINEQNKLKYAFLRDLIIQHVKKDYPIELNLSIQSRITNNLDLIDLEEIDTIQFSNNVLGQIWDITIDSVQRNSRSIENTRNEHLIPIIIRNRLHSLIIIRNSKLLTINDWLDNGTYIII